MADKGIIMKKLIAMMLMLCLLPLCALAELDEDGDVTVTLEGAEFFFTPIEGAHLLTRESSASAFNRFGLRQYELLEHMENYNIYAMMYFGNAVQGSVEAQIAAYASVDTDFDEMNEYGETLMCESLKSAYIDQGHRVSAAEIYRAPEGHTFVRLSVAYDGDTGEELLTVYITCQAGCTVELRFFPFDGPLTEEQQAAAELLADSLWITAAE